VGQKQWQQKAEMKQHEVVVGLVSICPSKGRSDENTLKHFVSIRALTFSQFSEVKSSLQYVNFGSFIQ
jgi:hypothetical protein